jgi:hypothetical protein
MVTLDIWFVVAIGLIVLFVGTLLGFRIAHAFRV